MIKSLCHIDFPDIGFFTAARFVLLTNTLQDLGITIFVADSDPGRSNADHQIMRLNQSSKQLSEPYFVLFRT
jgi:hypothetical protein